MTEVLYLPCGCWFQTYWDPVWATQRWGGGVLDPCEVHIHVSFNSDAVTVHDVTFPKTRAGA